MTRGADSFRALLRKHWASVLAVVGIVVVQAGLTAANVAAVKSGTGYGRRNLEASYHVLLTIRALRESPFSQTLGLPIATLGQANDKFIGWGSTVPNAFGDQVYTSFPPLGFWAPLVASLPLRNPGLAFLATFNGAIAVLVAVLVLLLTRRLAVLVGASSGAATLGGAAAALLYIVSPEALQSHGLVYWPQSLNQVFLVGSVLVLLSLMQGGSRRSGPYLLGALSAAACYTEWTGFVFAAISAVLCLTVRGTRGRLRPAIIAQIAGAALSGAVLLVQFGVQVGIGPAFSAWTSRADGRAAGSLPLLMYGWTLSAGATALALVILAAVLVLTRSTIRRPPTVVLLTIGLLLAPVVENLLLQQHASQFSFDRLKLVVPIAVAAGLVTARLGRRARIPALVAASVVALVIGDQMQSSDEAYYASWPATDASNRALAVRAAAIVDLRCATLGSSAEVRGYMNLLFDRGIVESTTLADLQHRVRSNPCGYVYITAPDAFTDLPAIGSIEVVGANGADQVLKTP